MNQDQFKQLDAPLLTRAIAEVVCGWFYVKAKGNCRSYFTLEKGGKNHCWAEDGLANSEYFRPLTSIDDAVLCVSKLDEKTKDKWQRKFVKIVKGEWDFIPLFDFVQATAELRCLALWNCVPEIEIRYKKLKGEK